MIFYKTGYLGALLIFFDTQHGLLRCNNHTKVKTFACLNVLIKCKWQSIYRNDPSGCTV